MECVESASKEKVIWWVVVSKKWEVMLGSAKGVCKLDSDVVAWQLWLSLLYNFSSLMAYEA